MKTFSLLIITLLSVLPFTSANANLLVNGNFELPHVANGTFRIFKNIPGWTTVSGAGIEVQFQSAGAPFDGNQLVELDSTNNSRMQQTVATVAGKRYLLYVAHSPRPGLPASSSGIQVLFNGAVLGTLQADGTGLANTLWNNKIVWVVTPTVNNSTVEFRAVGASDGAGAYIDDVILAPAD